MSLLCHFPNWRHKNPEVCQKTNHLSNPPAQENRTAEKSEPKGESQSVGNLQPMTPLTSARAVRCTHGRRLIVPRNVHLAPISDLGAFRFDSEPKQPAFSSDQCPNINTLIAANLSAVGAVCLQLCKCFAVNTIAPAPVNARSILYKLVKTKYIGRGGTFETYNIHAAWRTHLHTKVIQPPCFLTLTRRLSCRFKPSRLGFSRLRAEIMPALGVIYAT